MRVQDTLTEREGRERKGRKGERHGNRERGRRGRELESENVIGTELDIVMGGY